MDATQKYAPPLRLLHWLMAMFIIGLLATGLTMEDYPDEFKKTAYSLHKSFGVTVLGLFFIRLAVRLKTVLPPYPASMPSREKLLAKAVVWLFYGAMLVMPLSGWLMSNSKGYPVEWFTLPMPNLTGKNDAIHGFTHETHELVGYALIALILLHIAGIIKHRLKEGVSLMDRMR